MRHIKFPIICSLVALLGLAGATMIGSAGQPARLARSGDPLSSSSAAPTAPPPASRQPEGRAIEATQFADSLPPDAQRRLLIKVEVLLDRAHFSPGVIDGTPGENLHNALAAYAQAHGLASEGTLTPQIFGALAAADKAPVTQDYVITVADEKGPFIGAVPESFTKLARLKALGYRSPEQELAERFHMSEELLRVLNPKADFSKAGTTILVVRPGTGDLPADIARVEVDKGTNQLRVYNGAGSIVAAFPATVGSTERPAPSGRWAVKSVTLNPTYVYDPRKLTFGPRRKGVFEIKPGPNNPVGLVWIALTKPTYGIHGAPDPTLVGKTASHGCVRLTNWDATALARAVKSGTPVIFVGQETKG